MEYPDTTPNLIHSNAHFHGSYKGPCVERIKGNENEGITQEIHERECNSSVRIQEAEVDGV